ncbi:hypothetical protein [Natronoglycomyces albus]|uniref:Uncharacterized protein n=1 Tax=Natronoglycomyces albus TaxID=2811108 RepID=A0A895XSE7_9ACTN|nr:hypothetical protein [Natronoglycomyces albus]QSB04558.1 hypothetical protein JQS30_12350 [Natronoglycomyces albus]
MTKLWNGVFNTDIFGKCAKYSVQTTGRASPVNLAKSGQTRDIEVSMRRMKQLETLGHLTQVIAQPPARRRQTRQTKFGDRIETGHVP